MKWWKSLRKTLETLKTINKQTERISMLERKITHLRGELDHHTEPHHAEPDLRGKWGT